MDLFIKNSGILFNIENLSEEIAYYGCTYHSLLRPMSNVQKRLHLRSVKRRLYKLIDQVNQELFLLEGN